MIVESVDRLDKRVTENRIKYPEGVIKLIIGEIERELAITLLFELEDRGYLDRARHYLNEREYEWDYPDIFLIVKKKQRVFEFPVDPYQIDEPFDKSELISKVSS